MRRFPVLLMLLLLAPLGAADVKVEDPEGDVWIDAGGENAGTSDQFPDVDILETWIGSETEETVEIGIEVKEYQPTAGFPRLRPHFLRGETQYEIWFRYTESGGADAELRRAEDGILSRVADLEASFEPPGRFSAVVAKGLLTDDAGIPLRAGETLTAFYATAARQMGLSDGQTTLGATARDRAPDTGFANEFLAVLGEMGGRGDLLLETPVPIRVSNGEATTIVYPLSITNRAASPAQVLVSTDGVASTWGVRVPPVVDVPASGTITVPSILSIPFDHRHGETEMFQVRVVDAEDEQNFGHVTLGVHWLSIAQPAGHHDTLYLHTAAIQGDAFGRQDQWMNTLGPGDDPAADDTDIERGAATGRIQGAPPYDYPFTFNLRPELLLGLDFAEGLGDVALTASPSLDAQAHLEADVALACPPGPSRGCEREVLFEGSSDTVSWRGKHTFEVELARTTEKEVIPFDQLRNLEFMARIVTDTPQQGPAAAAAPLTIHVQDSFLRLPLDEYHDPVDQAFEDIGALRMVPQGGFERGVNPGRGTVFAFDVVNSGEAADLAFSVLGPAADWATLDREEATLAAGENRTVRVRVAAPDGASPETSHDFVLVAEDVGHPQSAAIAKFRVSVVDPAVEEIPDEPLVVTPGGKHSPATVAGLLGVAVAVALARRR